MRKLATWADAHRWLRTAAVRAAVDARRRAREARRAIRPDAADPDDGPEAAVLQGALRAGLAKLPAASRQVVALIFFEGLSVAAAARVVGRDRDTVAAWRDAALKRLRQSLPVGWLAAGGTAGVEGALTAGWPVVSSVRLGELGRSAWTRAAVPGPVLGKAVAVLLAGLTLGGVGLTGWTMVPAPGPDPKVPPEQPPAVSIASATYQQELLQKFEARFKDRLLEALRPLALGDGGRVVLTEVDAQGPRLRVEVSLRHGRPYNRTSRLVFVRDTWSGETYPMTDFLNTGDMGDYHPRHYNPPALLKALFGPLESRVKGTMAAATAVVAELPADPRAAVEQVRFQERYKAAAAPLLGEWRTAGPKPEPVWLEWDEAQPMPLVVTVVRKDGKGYVPFAVGWHVARIGPDGWPMDLGSYRRPNRVSADARRIDFFDPGGKAAYSLVR